ncbi:hypothetical protein JD844_033035 [Phrynosoma platyrhinos]|uniref:KIND domain-containing protein n=1 Tax=Phrynosoma platyrhinos TaxID=52577 RepID=A0ABQ7T6F1_PHRPL|nr:hypothetical protein JD844_033035 [Phrynosoma platyrhinos]
MVGGRKLGNATIYTKDLTKVSLAEFLRYYEQPISEEQAWAICFQSCCKMKQILAQGPDSALPMTTLDVDNLYIHSDGSVSFTLQHDFDNHTGLEQKEALEEKLAELLGRLIYKSLDWGIESHMERELSESLEKLICFMLKLNTETTKTAIALQDIIKICEDHFLKPSEAASHYTVICKLLFAEYSELQKLMLTIQSCKKYLGEMDVEDCSRRQKAKDWVGLWQGVLGDLHKGVKLHKVMEQLPCKRVPEEGTHLLYSTVVDDIKNKRYTLCKASARKLKERLCPEPSLHEQLMKEVKDPPKLQPAITERRTYGDNCKESLQNLVLNSPCDSIFSEQNIGTLDFSNAKRPRLSCVTSDPEPKPLLTNNQKTSTKLSLPTIADLMRARYSEIIDSSERDQCVSSRAQVCLICHSQYFIWPYMCHLCSSVICKDCCIKVIRLTKEEDTVLKDQKTAQLLYEIEHWDSPRVPLVFEPHSVLAPLASHTKSMMEWPSMDICTKCEQYLLEILSQQSPYRKRSLSLTEFE